VLAREQGDLFTLARALGNLGEAVFYQGHLTRARALLEESLALCEQLGMTGGLAATCCILLGEVARKEEDLPLARKWYAESLRRHQALGARGSIPECLECFGRLEIAQGQYPQGVRLIGLANALREAFGIVLPPVEQADLESDLDRARAALEEQAFATAWAAGRRLSLEQAIEQVLH
jgi:hypothetical protein